MNILFVNNIPFNPIAGGIERVTDILAKELGQRGYNIFYLCGKLNAESLYLLDYDFPAKLYQLPEKGLFDNYTNCNFYKQLQKEQKIDIVINQRGLGGWFNGILPNTTSKLISVIHSVPDGDIEHRLDSLIKSSAPPFAKLKGIIKNVAPFIFKNYWRHILRNDLKSIYEKLAYYSEVIVTLSKKDIYILNNYISSKWKYKIHSVGNPNSYRHSESICLLNKKRILLYVGRLDKWEKSPMRLLQLWKYLNRKFPDWQLKIVGDGPEKSAMEDYVKNNNLTNVFFEGQKKDVSKYYNEASMVCLTSNYEGWGMALTEGMQFGCIPFTFNNYGAASEIIDDNVNGCLIPPFNLKNYANRLKGLMEDESKRKAMSKAAIEKVEKFSAKNIADKWEDLIQKL